MKSLIREGDFAVFLSISWKKPPSVDF